MLKKIVLFLFILTATTLFANVQAKGRYYVNTKTLKVRMAPSTKARHSYSIYKNQKVRVYEVKDNWARISRYKTTTIKGKFTKAAKWVFGKYLTPTKVRKKKNRKKSSTKKRSSYKKNTKLTQAISGSDNYKKHSKTFQSVSQKLLKEGRCKLSDFRKTRGWIELSRDDLYFTYCGGFSRKNKIYLNVKSGVLQTFK